MGSFAGELHRVMIWWLDKDISSGSTTLEQNIRGTLWCFYTTKVHNQYSWSISYDDD